MSEGSRLNEKKSLLDLNISSCTEPEVMAETEYFETTEQQEKKKNCTITANKLIKVNVILVISREVAIIILAIIQEMLSFFG